MGLLCISPGTITITSPQQAPPPPIKCSLRLKFLHHTQPLVIVVVHNSPNFAAYGYKINWHRRLSNLNL